MNLLLPRLSANEAQAFSRIARYGANLCIELSVLAPGCQDRTDPSNLADLNDPEGPVDQMYRTRPMQPSTRWDIEIARGANPGVAAAADRSLHVCWWGAHWRLDLADDMYAAWLDARLPDLSPGPLSPELAEAASEVLLEETFALLARSPGGAPRLCAGDVPGPPLAHTFTLAVRSQITGTAAFAILSTDALGLMLLAGMVADYPSIPPELNEDDLLLTVRATLGTTHLSVTETGRLQPNDVVFIDDYRVDQDGEFWLSATPTHGLRVKREGSSYLVTQGWISLVSDAYKTSSDGDSAAAAFDIEQIPVTLSFDLGELAMTLAELRRLAPGEVFDLQRPIASGPVTVRANGARYASGTLVEVEGRVGVMIAAVGAPPP